MSDSKTIIFDLGDVLFNYSLDHKTTLPPNFLKRSLAHPAWFDYERGKISEAACYESIGHAESVDPSQLQEAFSQARMSLTINPEMVNLIEGLRSQFTGTKIIAMSNISAVDYDFVRETRGKELAIFDQIFTSCEAGERKPHLGFYRYVIKRTGLDPGKTTMVDDKEDNILTARSMGMHGIVFQNVKEVKRCLLNFLSDPVERGLRYLRENAGSLHCETDDGTEIRENFCQLLLLETLKDRTLVDFIDHPRTWQFFTGPSPDRRHDHLPHDLDTTSLGLTILPRDISIISSVLDEMLTYSDNDGIMQTYFDRNRPRICPAVCANILTLFYTHGRGRDVRSTFDWVYQVLLNRAYLHGTRYYFGPEPFLYFLSRLILAAPAAPEVQSRLKPVFIQRLRQRIGFPGNVLELAMRILACASVGIKNGIDIPALSELQCQNGSWESGWFYLLPNTMIKVGNRGLTTALAIRAVEAVRNIPIAVSEELPVARNLMLPQPSFPAQPLVDTTT